MTDWTAISPHLATGVPVWQLGCRTGLWVAVIGSGGAKLGGLGAFMCHGLAIFSSQNVMLRNGVALLGCCDTTFSGALGCHMGWLR